MALEERINDQPTKQDLLQRRILKRPSISRSLQPNAEALEVELLRNLAKYSAEDMESAQRKRVHHDRTPTTPLFLTDSHSNKSNGSSMNGMWPYGGGMRGGHRRRNSGFGTSKV